MIEASLGHVFVVDGDGQHTIDSATLWTKAQYVILLGQLISKDIQQNSFNYYILIIIIGWYRPLQKQCQKIGIGDETG